MSRITGTDAYDLMEAYNAVYAPQELTEEQIWEEVETWVNSLLEEGYDLSEYTWEEMYEAYLSEMGQPGARPTGQNSSVFTLPTTPSAGSAGGSGSGGRRGSGSSPSVRYSTPNPSFQQSGGFGRYAAPSAQVKTPATRTPAATPAARTPAATPAARTPAGTPPGGKVAPTKPAVTAQTGDKAKDMATFAKANPALAAAAAERARTRGTSSTTNPLMKDMKSRLPAAAPKVTPSNTLSNTVAAASKPAAFSPAPEVKATNTIAAKTTPTPVAPKAPTLGSKKPGSMVSHFDPFDVIKGHLIDEGYADTEEAALKIMANMSESWKNSIIG